MTNRKEQQAHEKATIAPALDNAGVKLIFGKFNEAADALPLQAIQALLVDDIPKAKRCAYLWDTYKCQLPRITENIMNSDFDILKEKQPDRKPWRFFSWLFNK